MLESAASAARRPRAGRQRSSASTILRIESVIAGTRSTTPRHLGAERRQQTALLDRGDMRRIEIGIDDSGKCGRVIIVLAYPLPSRRGMGERGCRDLSDQRLLRGEMRIEPAMRQASRVHDRVHPDRVDPPLAEQCTGGFQDPLSRLGLSLPAHGSHPYST